MNLAITKAVENIAILKLQLFYFPIKTTEFMNFHFYKRHWDTQRLSTLQHLQIGRIYTKIFLCYDLLTIKSMYANLEIHLTDKAYCLQRKQYGQWQGKWWKRKNISKICAEWNEPEDLGMRKMVGNSMTQWCIHLVTLS